MHRRRTSARVGLALHGDDVVRRRIAVANERIAAHGARRRFDCEVRARSKPGQFAANDGLQRELADIFGQGAASRNLHVQIVHAIPLWLLRDPYAMGGFGILLR